MRTKISKGKLIKILKKTPEVPNKGLSNIKNKDTSHKDWLKGEFISSVQQRGKAIIEARKLSSAMSAANAVGVG